MMRAYMDVREVEHSSAQGTVRSVFLQLTFMKEMK